MCQHTASWSSCTQVPGHRLSFTYLSQGVSLYPSTADGGDFCWAYFLHHGTHLNLETELPTIPESFPQEEGAHQRQASNQQEAATTERSISGMTVALAGGSACSSKVPREQEAAVTPPAPSSRAGRCSWERATFSSNCINLGTAHMCCEAKGRMGPRRGASAFRLHRVLQQDTRSLRSPADTSAPDKHRQELQPFQQQFSSFLFGALFYCKQVFPDKPCSVLDLLEPMACGILWHLITFAYKGIAKLRNTWNNPED